MCWQSKHAAEGVFRKRPNERTASRWVKSLKQSTSVVLPGQPADRDYAFITAFLEKLKEYDKTFPKRDGAQGFRTALVPHALTPNRYGRDQWWVILEQIE